MALQIGQQFFSMVLTPVKYALSIPGKINEIFTDRTFASFESEDSQLENFENRHFKYLFDPQTLEEDSSAEEESESSDELQFSMEK